MAEDSEDDSDQERKDRWRKETLEHMGTLPKRGSPLSPKQNNSEDDEENKDYKGEDGNTSLMAQDVDKEEEEAPLHDLM